MGGRLLVTVFIAAHAAPSGFEFVREADGCQIAMRPEDHEDGAAMRADCDWPEIDAAHLVELLGQYQRYPEYVFAISESRVEREEADRVLVYQSQHLFGISDREVLLWMTRVPVEGGARFSWTTASELPLALEHGSIRTPRNDGFWEVVPRAEGGSHVVHEIAMDAGGSIPRWVVNLVRTRSFAKIMGDVRRIAAPGDDDVRSARTP